MRTFTLSESEEREELLLEDFEESERLFAVEGLSSAFLRLLFSSAFSSLS